MSSVQPEKFESGNFVTWLRQFEGCAAANLWDDEKKVAALTCFPSWPRSSIFSLAG